MVEYSDPRDFGFRPETVMTALMPYEQYSSKTRRLILVKGAHVTDRARLIFRYMGHCDHLSGSFRLHQVYRGWDLS